MAFLESCTQCLIKRPAYFLWRSFKAFRRNQGFLLSGAVAYHMLLSIVPLLALLLVGLSQFMDEQALLETVQSHLELLVPGETQAMTTQIISFLENREVIGWLGIAVLIFFSTLAFTVLENAMSVIFFHRVNIHRRHFLISALIPFVFILLVGAGVLLITFVSGGLQAIDRQHIELFGYSWDLAGASGIGLYLLGFMGLVALLSSLYLVMPVGKIAIKHALIGGVVAGLLWELTRHALVWYFSTLSLVNLIYGSFATTIIVLLSFEAAALILLFGAQVIAEFEQSRHEGDFVT